MKIEKYDHLTATAPTGMPSSDMRRVWWVDRWIATQVSIGQYLFSKCA